MVQKILDYERRGASLAAPALLVADSADSAGENADVVDSESVSRRD